MNSQETNILFKNFNDIFSKIKELQLHKKRIRKKLKGCLNASKMADTNRTLNMSLLGNEVTGNYGFESARSANNNSAELTLRKDERLSRTLTKQSSGEVELATLHTNDVDVT